MSASEPPLEPAQPEREDRFPAPEAAEEYDQPYTAPPRPPSRPTSRAPGAVRAFLFLTAAFIVGSAVGQSLGLALALALLRGQVPVHTPAEFEAALPRLLQHPLTMACIGGVSLLLLLAVTAGFARGWDRRPVSSVGLEIDRRSGCQFLMGMALGAVLMGALFAVESGLGWLRIAAVIPFPRSLAHAFVWLGALLPAAAAEEVLLRGYAFQSLEEQWGGAAALLITALVFGALHGMNPDAGWSSLGGIFAAGLLMGAGVLATGRLWLPIGLHVAWNLFEGPILGFPVSGMQFPGGVAPVVHGPVLWTGGDFGPEAGLLSVLASLAGTALLLLAARRRAIRGRE